MFYVVRGVQLNELEYLFVLNIASKDGVENIYHEFVQHLKEVLNELIKLHGINRVAVALLAGSTLTAMQSSEGMEDDEPFPF